MRIPSLVTAAAITGLIVGFGQMPIARAQDKPADAPAAWSDTIKFSGYINGGITANPDNPHDGENFGQLFTDRANMPALNQFSLIAERPLDPKATGYDFGFRAQAIYGTDARYTHFLGEFDRSINSRYQVDIIEADALAHLPLVTAGGIDLKVGQYPTPLGYEVITPAGNPFYSHSYIFQFGLPFKHTGALSTMHVSEMLDLYLGVDTGTNTSLGKNGDNNGALGGIGGFGLNLRGGNLTILALTHIGPENARNAGENFNVNGANRYFNDIVLTWKATDKWTFTTEANYVKDDGFNASGYGAAQYASYALNDTVTLQGRAEVWRDANGFYVAAFPGNFDFVNAERGLPNGAFFPGRTTYTEITGGLNIKLPVPAMFEGAMLRPEIRWDNAAGTHPFDGGSNGHQVTLASDVILPF